MRIIKMNKFFLLFIIAYSIFFSCENSLLPKQSGFLKMDFKDPKYKIFEDENSLIDFYYNSSFVDIEIKNPQIISLQYPEFNLSMDLFSDNMRERKDLDNNLTDFSLILDTHSIRSNGIIMREYENIDKKVYGKLFEITGDVASPIKFYLTDSVSNFISGSINLKFKSKYDSIYPLIQYVKNDILVLFQSINWN